MILYALACDSGHRFESWFRDSAAYDGQVAHDLVACPTCHSTHVAKAIMAPAVVGGRLGERAGAASGASADTSDTASAGTALTDSLPRSDASKSVALMDDKSRALRDLIRGFRDKLVAEGHDVGADFAAEARRIHDGETPPRQIYGQASPAEARDLLDDGIMVLPMPVMPDELN